MLELKSSVLALTGRLTGTGGKPSPGISPAGEAVFCDFHS